MSYQDAPGYKHIKIQPHTGGGLTDVAATLQTYYGPVSSHWKIQNKQLHFEIEVPPNTTATVYIPAASATEITESNRPLSSTKGIRQTGQKKGYIIVEVGSGKYVFKSEQ